jgi:hypothetical protein
VGTRDSTLAILNRAAAAHLDDARGPRDRQSGRIDGDVRRTPAR